MPIPSPRGGQDKDNFVSSCMSNETMKKEFPNEKQRVAVCHSKYKQSKKNSKNSKGSEIEWNNGEVDDNLYILY